MTDDTLTFLTVCRQGSFLAAGRVLGQATSTVSRRIDQLEARLGARLFERSTRGLTLTEAGRTFRERATIAEEALREAEDAVRAVMKRPAGRLRVAVPSAMLRDPIGAIALEYLRTYPEVSLEMVGTDENVVPDGDQLHIVVRASRRPPPPHLIQRVLGQVPMRLCASPGWLGRHPAPTDPRDLTAHGCVVLGGDPDAARVRMRRGAEERGLTVPIALFTTSISMARRAGLAGVGPVGLPAISCADLLARDELVELLPDWALDPVRVVALYAGDREPPLRVRAFLDLLVSAFA